MPEILLCPRCGNPVSASAASCGSCGLERTNLPVGTASAVTSSVGFPHSMLYGTKRYFKRYAMFSGRTGALEFWSTVLTVNIISVVLLMVAHPIQQIFALITICPNFALNSRRLHDIGKSAWLQLWCLTLFGCFYVLYLYCLPSQPDSNEYGAPDPLTEE